MTTQSQIVRDMERKVVEAVQDTMKRELEIARHVMQPMDISLLLIILAKGSICTAAAMIGSMAREPSMAGQLFDTVVDQIFEQVRTERAYAIGKMAEANGLPI